MGQQVPVLGTERLRMVQVVSKALATGFKDVAEQLGSSGVLARCCDIFLRFEWHSLMHASVAPAIKNVVGLTNTVVEEALFRTYPLLTKFMDAYAEANDAKHGKRLPPANLGWMHVIFNQIVQVHDVSAPDSTLVAVCDASE